MPRRLRPPLPGDAGRPRGPFLSGAPGDPPDAKQVDRPAVALRPVGADLHLVARPRISRRRRCRAGREDDASAAIVLATPATPASVPAPISTGTAAMLTIRPKHMPLC